MAEFDLDDSEQLPEEILNLEAEVLRKVQEANKGRKHLAKHNPCRWLRIARMYLSGRSKKDIRNTLNVAQCVVNGVIYDVEKHGDTLRELYARQLSIMSMDLSDIIGDNLADLMRQRDIWNKENPDKAFPVSARDLKDLAITHQIMTNTVNLHNGDPTQRVEHVKKYTIDDAKKLADAIFGKPIDAEVINVDSE